jgi:SulP family sulfate permease
MVLLKPWVSQVPVAALVAIMVMVSIDTFDWSSLRTMVVPPEDLERVMLATVVVTVASANLALGRHRRRAVERRVLHLQGRRLLKVDGSRMHRCETSLLPRLRPGVLRVRRHAHRRLRRARDRHGALHIDVSQAHFWDITAVAALKKVVERLRKHGSVVEVSGLNQASQDLILQLDAAPD